MDHYLYVQISKSSFIGLVIAGTLTMLLCLASIWLIAALYTRKRLLYEERAKRQASEFETRLQTERTQETDRILKAITAALHDHVGNRLSLLVSILGDLQNLHRRNFPLSAGDLALVRNLAAEVMDDVREINRIMEGKALLEKGLVHAVQAWVAQVRQVDGLTVNFHHESAQLHTFDEQTLLHVFRIIQESVSNSIKHAKAHTLTLSITSTEDEALQVNVVDDGCGFDAATVDDSSSLGLTNMRYRAEATGGDLDISSKPGYGTRIRLRVPPQGIP